MRRPKYKFPDKAQEEAALDIVHERKSLTVIKLQWHRENLDIMNLTASKSLVLVTFLNQHSLHFSFEDF